MTQVILKEFPTFLVGKCGKVLIPKGYVLKGNKVDKFNCSNFSELAGECQDLWPVLSLDFFNH